MSNFVKLLKNIRYIANNLSSYWDNKFQPDELISEAWIRGLKCRHSDAPIIIQRARYDMQDYIKDQVGRQYVWKNGKKQKKKQENLRPNFYTGDYINRYGKHVHVDKCVEDKNLLKLENRELIIHLLLNKTATKRSRAMICYYLKERNLKQTGKLMNFNKSTICQLLKQGREDCKEAIEKMDLIDV